MKLIYLPCECYEERWTKYVSGPTGVIETQLKQYEIPYRALRPHTNCLTIKSGVVLDTYQRTKWCGEQVAELCRQILNNDVAPGDVIYIEDFWQGAMEMIPYTLDMVGKLHLVKIFSFCHAQSVDPYDFTTHMAPWMRGFEKAWANCQNGIFAAAPEMTDRLLDAGVTPRSGRYGLHPVGTMFDADVFRRVASVPDDFESCAKPRSKDVLFSSRWDSVKCPEFFCDVAEEVLRTDESVRFLVCTGSETLRSDKPELVLRAKNMAEKYPARFVILENLSKEDYFQLLQKVKVQFNCADHDYVSYTLLEASFFGAAPLYPRYLTFPDALEHRAMHLYRKGDIASALEKLQCLLELKDKDHKFRFHEKYQWSFARALTEMGFKLRLPEDMAAVPELTKVYRRPA